MNSSAPRICNRLALLATPALLLLAVSLGTAGNHRNQCCKKPTLDLDDGICPNGAGCLASNPCEPGTLVVSWNDGGCRSITEPGEWLCGPERTTKKKKLYTCDASSMYSADCEPMELYWDCDYVEQGDDVESQTVATCVCDPCPES